jgi:hypothetical protein
MREMGRLTKRPGAAAATHRFLAEKRMERIRNAGDEAVKAIAKLNEEQVKNLLAYTEEELLADIEKVKNGDRNSMSILGMMKERLGYTVTKPEQRLVGDVSVQVVVNSMRKPAYELPEGSTTSTLPEE